MAANKSEQPQINPDDLKNIGINALASGKISAEDAEANAQSVGLMPKSQQPGEWLQNYLSPPSSQSPYTLSSQGEPAKPPLAGLTVPNPGGAASGKKGSVIKSELTGKQSQGMKTTANTNYSPDELLAMTQSIENTPGMRDEKSGIAHMQDMLNMTQNTPYQKPDDAWLKPLIALADSQTGSHLMAGFTPGMTPQQRQEQLLKYGNDLQQRKSDYNKQVLEGVSKLKSGTQQDTMNQTLMQLQAMNQNNAAGGSALSEVRRQNAIVAAGAAYDKDPILKQLTTTTNSLDRATSLMNGKTPVTSQVFNELQQDMINALAPGGAATEGKISRGLAETLYSKINEIQTRFGNVNDLRTEQPEIFNQLQKIINQVRADYSSAGQQRAGEIRKNYEHVTDPDIQQTAYDKYDLLNTKFQKPSKEYSGIPGSTPPAKKYEDMTTEELRAHVKTLEGKGS